MVSLAVATQEETFERIRDPLAERGVRVEPLVVDERTLPLTGGEPFDGREYDVGFVYPSRLMEGGAADALLSLPWVNDRDAVVTSRNKAAVYATLSRAGLPVPETTLVSNPVAEADLVAAADELGFPLVVKPNSTTRGVGVARVTDLDSLLGVADYLSLVHDYRATGDRSFLLQESLPDARDYRAMVVDGECVGAVERRLPERARTAGRWKHNVHRGAEAVGVDLPERHRDLAEAAAEALGIPYLGVDLLESGDGVVVNETNARPTVDAATKYEPDFYDRLAALVRSRA
jgi:ribosomal protein S6--L-glutamate ligase